MNPSHQVTLLAEAIAHLAEGVLITSDDLEWPGPEILFVNKALCQITGYTADELLGQTPRVLQNNETSRDALDRIKQELAAGRSCQAELVNTRKNGSPYDAEVFITPLFDAESRRTNFVSIHRDITERKRTEQALHSSKERMQAILKTAFSPIITIDRRGVIQSFNSAAEKAFGYAAADVIGQNVKLLMPSPYREEHDGYIQRYRQTGEARIIGFPRELVALRKDGSTFPIELSVTEIDHLGLFTGIMRDLTERNALQRHVLEIANEEQRRIGQELHDGTAQELTGLSLIARALFSLLAAVPKKEADGQAVRQLNESEFTRLVEITAKLIHNLTESNEHVRQLSHGIMPVHIDAEGLRAALEDLAASTNSSPDIRCRYDCPMPIHVTNNTTATHLYRIAQEAVHNAVRHSQAEEIGISLTEQGNHLVLEISDNGVGFPAAVNHVQATRQNHGMGLRTMHYRAGLLGGMLQIERRPAGGTVVRCTLPRERPVAVD